MASFLLPWCCIFVLSVGAAMSGRVFFDCEPDFEEFVLGISHEPALPAAGQIVVASAGAGALPAVGSIVAAVAGHGAGQLAAAAAGDGADVTPPPRRKHRKTHGAFGGVLASRTLEVKRAFSSNGNAVRLVVHRERQLQVVLF